jgi:SAM-dependent methyltransferase
VTTPRNMPRGFKYDHSIPLYDTTKGRRTRRSPRTYDATTSNCNALCFVVIFGVVFGVIVLAMSLDGEQRRRFFRLHWLPYVLPRAPPWFWDWLHSKQPGGLWKYNANVQTELTSFVLRTQPDYKSLLDVACNGGYMLQRLQKQRPKAKHYGTDISPAMVAATQSRCTECAGVAVYDLATLVIDEKAARSAGNVSITDEQGRVLPPSYDVVIVSDVLFFMPWAGLPPAANRFVPTSWLRASQKRLFDALTRMAKRVVVFSDHENNPYVVDFLQAMGAVRRPMVTLHGRKQRSVWTAAGRAP